MKYSSQDTRNTDSFASGNSSRESFGRQLSGYQALIGIPHWQMDNHLDSAAMERHIARGKVMRSRAFHSSLLSIGQSIGRYITKVNQRIKQRIRIKENVKELRTLSPRMLQDMGITPGDISAIASGAITPEQLNAQRLGISADISAETEQSAEIHSLPIRESKTEDEGVSHSYHNAA